MNSYDRTDRDVTDGLTAVADAPSLDLAQYRDMLEGSDLTDREADELLASSMAL